MHYRAEPSRTIWCRVHAAVHARPAPVCWNRASENFQALVGKRPLISLASPCVRVQYSCSSERVVVDCQVLACTSVVASRRMKTFRCMHGLMNILGSPARVCELPTPLTF